MDRVTLDFEQNTICWETDTQKGTEFSPELSRRKDVILAAMGCEVIDMTNALSAINGFLSGSLSQNELRDILESEASK